MRRSLAPSNGDRRAPRRGPALPHHTQQRRFGPRALFACARVGPAMVGRDRGARSERRQPLRLPNSEGEIDEERHFARDALWLDETTTSWDRRVMKDDKSP